MPEPTDADRATAHKLFTIAGLAAIAATNHAEAEDAIAAALADARAEAEVLTRRAETAEAALSTARRGWDTARAEADQLRDAMRALDVAHLAHQREWSTTTFGPGPRTKGVIDHIRKELAEIEAEPGDLGEWVDVIILAFDGAWRTGAEPEEIIAAVKAKQARNEARTWPDWRTADPDKAIEHDRGQDAARVRDLADGGRR